MLTAFINFENIYYISSRGYLQDGFMVESESGTKFGDVDLSESEWVEYDEKLGDSIGIYELEHKLQPHH